MANFLQHIMKSNDKMKRDYRQEYDKFQSSSSSKKDRASRNKLRRLFLRLEKSK